MKEQTNIQLRHPVHLTGSADSFLMPSPSSVFRRSASQGGFAEAVVRAGGQARRPYRFSTNSIRKTTGFLESEQQATATFFSVSHGNDPPNFRVKRAGWISW